jgi:hypothetical protein
MCAATVHDHDMADERLERGEPFQLGALRCAPLHGALVRVLRARDRDRCCTGTASTRCCHHHCCRRRCSVLSMHACTIVSPRQLQEHTACHARTVLCSASAEDDDSDPDSDPEESDSDSVKEGLLCCCGGWMGWDRRCVWLCVCPLDAAPAAAAPECLAPFCDLAFSSKRLARKSCLSS